MAGVLGVFGSALLLVVLPLQLAGFLREPGFAIIWIPIGVFEVTFALWLIIKGVAAPAMQPARGESP